jgi:hypothetical protein
MQCLKAVNIPEHSTTTSAGAFSIRDKENVEAGSCKFFPIILLLGFFGNGEIGYDQMVIGKFILRKYNEVKEHDLLHCYTTMVLVYHL